MTLLLDVVASVLLLGGGVLALGAGVGLIRFPDLLARMHTAAKPQVLGLILVLVGLGLRLRTGHVIWVLLLVVMFQLLTAPVAAHMVARAGYRTGKVDPSSLVVDELTRDLTAAGGPELPDEEPVAD
jgi:multicomponent Na+:H+ antiporter subunit G